MAKEKRQGRQFPNVEGLSRKRTKFGHRWILTERDSTGKSHSITVKILDTDTIDVYFRKITQARNELRNRNQNKDFAEYLHEYSVIRQLSPATVELYSRALAGFSFDEKKNKKRVHELLAKDLKPSSMNLYIGKIGTFFDWLQKRGETVKNPVCDIMIKAKSQPRKRTFTDDELRTLIGYARRHQDKSYTLFVLLLIETGARVSTISALTVKDLDANGMIHLYNVKSRKDYDYSFEIRSEEIKRLWEFRRGDGELWKEPPKRYWKRLCQWMRQKFHADENGERLSPHSLRHTFASRAIQNGVPLEIISKLLDHSSPTITLKIYARFSQEQINDAFEKAAPKSDGL